MKTKITLLLTVLGVAAAVVPAADAKVSAPVSGGGNVCICLPVSNQ